MKQGGYCHSNIAESQEFRQEEEKIGKGEKGKKGREDNQTRGELGDRLRFTSSPLPIFQPPHINHSSFVLPLLSISKLRIFPLPPPLTILAYFVYFVVKQSPFILRHSSFRSTGKLGQSRQVRLHKLGFGVGMSAAFRGVKEAQDVFIKEVWMCVAKGVCIGGGLDFAVGFHGCQDNVEKGVGSGLVVSLQWTFREVL